MRCAVQVPEHIAARQVPDPDDPLSLPKPTARLMPLVSVTRMAPASATRPEAVTAALLEATRPLLIPIETNAPLLQAAFDETIWTFHSPSNFAAIAGAAVKSVAKSAKRETRDNLREFSIALPLFLCRHRPTAAQRKQ